MRVVIVDRQPLIHEAMRGVLREIDPAAEVVAFADPRAACDAIGDPTAIDLAVVDVGNDGNDGALDWIESLHSLKPALPIVALGEDAPRAAGDAIIAGASGYLARTARPAVVSAALRAVLAGGVYLPAGFARVAQTARSGDRRAGASPPALTSRQSQVLALIAQGKPNKLICRELRLSEGTVKVHVSAVLRALNVANRTQAAIAAARLAPPGAAERRASTGDERDRHGAV